MRETAQFSNRATAGRVERGPYSGHSPDRNGQIKARSQATGKVCGEPVLSLWNESRTNRARIADSVLVGIRSRPHLVARPVRTTKSC